jgi:serine protease Do
MYNDENNLYHYTYRKDGSEASEKTLDEQLNDYQARQSGQETGFADTPPQQPIQQGPVKKMHKAWKGSRKILAMALACALVGGAAGAGITAAVNHSSSTSGSTSINVSKREATEVTLKSVDGATEMSDAENYAANVNSVVSINCSAATTNFFGQTVESASSGSGFIITADGYIVTNQHVIADASSIKVTLYNGDTYDAKVIGSDEDYDIAVLKIAKTGLQPVTMGDSDKLNVGDQVLAVGNPLGELTFSMTAGIVSCVNRAINVNGTPFNMIQIDASINAGNSGGPLLNSYGEVVGIVSAKYSSSGTTESVEGLGFAIPINDVMAMIQDIMTNGYVTNKPYLGATVGTISDEMAQKTNLTAGAYIYSVTDGGAAAKAGLKVGDVITKIDDTKITSLEDLTVAKKSYSAGDTATFTINRSGKTMTVKVTWGQQPKEEADTSTSATQNQSGTGSQDNQDNQDDQDIFNYFFNQNGSGQSGQNSQSNDQSGTGTAA